VPFFLCKPAVLQAPTFVLGIWQYFFALSVKIAQFVQTKSMAEK